MRFAVVLSFALTVQVSSFAAAPNSSPASYYADFVEAGELLKRKEYEPARTILERLVHAFPDDSSTWISYAIALSGLHRDEEAIGAAEQGIAIGGVPSERYSYFEIAKLYARNGKREQALDLLERALASRFTPRTQILHEPVFQAFVNDERFRRISGQLPLREFSRDDGWRYDIAFVAEEARRLHPSPAREAFSEEFERATKALSDAVPSLSDVQIKVKLQALLTLLHDGHSGVDIDQDARRLPVRLYFFKDGVFVIDATADLKALIGSRVLRIGSRAVEELLSELPQYVPRDNAMGIKWRGPRTLTGMEFLQALGATDSLESATLTLERSGRKPRVVKVTSVAAQPQELVTLVPPAKAAAPAPPYLKRLSTTYWFEPITAQTLYLQFSGVYNMSGGPSIPEFADALQKEIDKGAVQNLIVDVRLNPGGDLGLYPPLLRVLAGFGASSPQHRVYCIIGRNTFSAAQAFIGDLERFVNPVFVGEPSGSSPNFTGESTGWFELPYSRTRVNISERYHQHSTFPDDGRNWIAPRIPVELGSSDYFANRDPALEAVLAVISEKCADRSCTSP